MANPAILYVLLCAATARVSPLPVKYNFLTSHFQRSTNLGRNGVFPVIENRDFSVHDRLPRIVRPLMIRHRFSQNPATGNLRNPPPLWRARDFFRISPSRGHWGEGHRENTRINVARAGSPQRRLYSDTCRKSPSVFDRTLPALPIRPVNPPSRSA